MMCMGKDDLMPSRSIADDLKALAGPRSSDADLARALVFCEERLTAWSHRRQDILHAGKPLVNLIAERPGDGRWIVVCAHLDTLPHTPGANDNASGVAVVLRLAEVFHDLPLPGPGLRLVISTGEEDMARDPQAGSSAHLDLTGVVTFLAVDTVGYYDARWGTQACPAWWWRPWFGWRGNYVAVVGPPGQQGFRRRLAKAMTGPLPVRALRAPRRWSLAGDHATAAKVGIPAVRITDTDRWRDPEYHRSGDTPQRLAPAYLPRVANAVAEGIATLLGIILHPSGDPI